MAGKKFGPILESLTLCMRGARAKELSAHRPVTTISAPPSKALAIGPAL